jgi:hypothetical protein
VASRHRHDQLLGVLHGQEQHSTLAQQMVGEAEEEAHVEQVSPKEHETRKEAPEEQDGSSSKDDSDEEGAPWGGDQQPQQQINYMLVEF